MTSIANKRIVLGVSGSIAAYKSADLVRRLREQGADVRVILTDGGSRFITALTLQALSGHPVRQALTDAQGEAAMGHIEMARWADAVLVAPASADFLARLAGGRADDLLAAVCLATDAPVLVAPAMNRRMWANPATQENLERIAGRGVAALGPDEGEQACGEIGAGRMLEPDALVDALARVFDTGALSGLAVLITAGPTHEAIDPVRFLGNRSSGKMGFALAQAAAEAGARVCLVAGPVSLPTPERVERIDVVDAREMFDAVMSRAADCAIFIGAAAVADYRPAQVQAQKLKKSEAAMTLALERNPDIVAAVAALERGPLTVGFAAETERVAEYARAKLDAKGMDMIAANEVGESKGFESDDNALDVFWPHGSAQLRLASKAKLARQLIDLVAERYYAKNTIEDS